MTRKSVFKMSDIMSFCAHQPSLLTRGENAFESNHVKSMVYDGECGAIVGKVQASMTSTLYKVTIQVNNGKVMSGHCTRVKGNAVCHHMMALMFCAHYNVSVTDVTCKWSVPSKIEDRNDGSSVDDLFPRRKAGYRAVQIPPGPDELERLRRLGGMCGDGAAGFLWLLEPEPVHQEANLSVQISSVCQVVKSKEFEDASNKLEYLKEKLAESWSTITLIAQLTAGQGSKPLWFEARAFRITLSLFGKVLKVKGRGQSVTLMKELTRQSNNAHGAHAVMWGRQNEIQAISTFEDTYKEKVQETGVWLHESGLLGASPDGLVGQDGLVEVKCPYTIRGSDSIAKGIASWKQDYILKCDKDTSQLTINSSHDYYHQIQGQLWFTKRSYCYLIVWIPKDCVVVKIDFDDEWGGNIPKLLDFYVKHLVPYIRNT